MLDAIHWPNSVRDWMDALGMRPVRPETASSLSTLESIRQIMLDTVDHADTGKSAAQKARLHVRILSARDAQALWYLRSDLMQLLSTESGEVEAGNVLVGISALFEGLIPVGFYARPAQRFSGYDGAMPKRIR